MMTQQEEPRPAPTLHAVLEAEYCEYANAVRAGDVDEAWHRLERAHIIAQLQWRPHITSHWKMLGFAAQCRDWREAAGQLLRLALAPVGNLTGRLPIGNTGRSTASAFAPMPIPADLQEILNRTSA